MIQPAHEAFIVVGIDGSPSSEAALRWAFEEARLRAAELRTVYAWSAFPFFQADTPLTLTTEDDLRVEAERLVREFVGDTIPDTGDVEITVLAPQTTSGVARTLVDLAEGAEMLVVGSRGLTGFSELVLGSISKQCVHQARCPVVVVRAARATSTQPSTASLARHT
jgi:nucleotide-binding universal stress UspA family protein